MPGSAMILWQYLFGLLIKTKYISLVQWCERSSREAPLTRYNPKMSIFGE